MEYEDKGLSGYYSDRHDFQRIRNQLKEDLEYDQMSLKEYIDPFTGESVGKGK